MATYIPVVASDEARRLVARKDFDGFACVACGTDFAGSPRMERFIAGGTEEGAGLCWVCNRLRVHNEREAVMMRRHFAYLDEPN